MSRRALVFFASALAIALVAAAPEPSNSFRFSIMGDRTGEAQPEVWGRVWREVDLLHPDFVINAGDVIQGGNEETADAEWRAAQAMWRRYSYPLFFTPGNHDIWSAASERLYQKYTGRPPFYSFDYQDAHFTVLDNSRSENLDEAQLKFLEQDLQAHRGRNPKFVFFHRPTEWLIALKFQSDFALHRIARRYGVTAVISGHTHQFARLEKDGVIYMCAPSAGGHLRGADNGAGFAQGWFYGHVLATVKGSRVEFTVKEIDGPKGKGRMFDAREWGTNGPEFDVNDPAARQKPGS